MDKVIISIKEGRSGIEAAAETTNPETSTLIERALAARVAERIPDIVMEEKKAILSALKGVAGALRAEDIAMLEGAVKGNEKEPEKDKGAKG